MIDQIQIHQIKTKKEAMHYTITKMIADRQQLKLKKQ